MKGYSAFPKAPVLLEPHHQIAYCHIQDTCWERGLTSLQRCSLCILQPHVQLGFRCIRVYWCLIASKKRVYWFGKSCLKKCMSNRSDPYVEVSVVFFCGFSDCLTPQIIFHPLLSLLACQTSDTNFRNSVNSCNKMIDQSWFLIFR